MKENIVSLELMESEDKIHEIMNMLNGLWNEVKSHINDFEYFEPKYAISGDNNKIAITLAKQDGEDIMVLNYLDEDVIDEKIQYIYYPSTMEVYARNTSLTAMNIIGYYKLNAA